MTIEELKNQEEGDYTTIMYVEGNSFTQHCTPVDEADVSDSDNAIDWTYTGDTELTILVQPMKVIKYIHVGAPAPQYAINSISSIRSAISYIASQNGIYAREDRAHDGTVDIILEPDTTDEQVAELIKCSKEYMEDEGYTGVDATSTMLTYDAGSATAEEIEPTRNW